MSVAIPATSRARMFQIGVNDWSGSAGNYSYTKSDMPTIAAGMYLGLYCDDTDYITTNGLTVTAGAGSITLTATAHPDQLNVLVLPIPEANAAHVVIFPDAYSKGQVDGMFGWLDGMKAVFYDRNGVTIPNTQPGSGGNPYSIDFSSAIPSGVSSPWAALVWVLHNNTYYALPYINGSGVAQTWVYGMSGNTLLIHSTTAWANAHVYMVLLTK